MNDILYLFIPLRLVLSQRRVGHTPLLPTSGNLTPEREHMDVQGISFDFL